MKRKDFKIIAISDSLENTQDSQIKYWSRLSPLERFDNFRELMNRFYDFPKPDWSTKKIVIDKGSEL
jgi:hypothetical protein